MTKEEVRAVLNGQRVNFHYVVGLLSKYFLTNPVKTMMLNYMVVTAKSMKIVTSIDMFKLFYGYAKDVVQNTRFSRI